MTTTTTADGRIKTTLCEKSMALYLFNPLHSAYPYVLLTGHIFGNTLRIFCLNSDENNITEDTVTFYRRYLAYEHTHDILTPLFPKAIENTRKFTATSNGQ